MSGSAPEMAESLEEEGDRGVRTLRVHVTEHGPQDCV